MTSIKYRADIDGLRAVAVLGVVIYHAFPEALPGGFIGVDIFFVISGYLISGILHKGLQDGNFSFKEFYARRIRRLFPALVTVLLLSLLYGRIVLLPDEFRRLGKHVAAGALFIQNIVFWNESGYFDVTASLKPLLHLWSLAVEEQFYIFFPPLMILVWKRKWPYVAIMAVLLFSSLLLNVVMSFQDAVPDFFLTPYRSWEFLAGALLMWYHDGSKQKEAGKIHWMSCFGAILIILGMLLIHRNQPYPGWRALLPVTATILVIAAGKESWINQRILSTPSVVWVGLVSYPLYLFHWPLLSFLRVVKGDNPSNGYIVGALVISLLLSTITYHLIERKLRRNFSRWTVPTLVLIFLMTGLTGLLVWKGIIPDRHLSWQEELIELARNEHYPIQGVTFLNQYRGMSVYKMGGSGPLTVLLGDSNADMYAPRFQELLKNNTGKQRGAIVMAQGGVPPLPGVTGNHQAAFPAIPDFRRMIAEKPEIDRIVIAARWGMYFDKKENYFFNGEQLFEKHARDSALEEFGRMIRGLVDSGKKVTVVLNIPSASVLSPENLHPRGFFGGFSKKTIVFTKGDFLNEYGALRNQIASVAKKNGAEIVDPLDELCINGVCIGETEGGPIYQDKAHLLRSFVSKKIRYLDSTLEP